MADRELECFLAGWQTFRLARELDRSITFAEQTAADPTLTKEQARPLIEGTKKLMKEQATRLVEAAEKRCGLRENFLEKAEDLKKAVDEENLGRAKEYLLRLDPYLIGIPYELMKPRV